MLTTPAKNRPKSDLNRVRAALKALHDIAADRVDLNDGPAWDAIAEAHSAWLWSTPEDEDAPSSAAARGPEGVRVPAELVTLSAAATQGPWTTRLHGLARHDYAEIDGQGWSKLASVTVQMEDDSFRSVEGLANLKLIAAAVNSLRKEISETARPSRAEGDGERR